MSNYIIDGKTLTDIADAIREKTDTPIPLNPTQMAQAISSISGGGGDSYYDAFWDNFQSHGTRVGYNSAFSGAYWNNENFKPKYDIVPSSYGVASIFNECGYVGDLVELCEKQGITIDFSNVFEFSNVFYKSNFTRIGVVDARKATKFYYVFSYASKLKTIDKIICSETTPLNECFGGLTTLIDVRFEGIIAKNVDIRLSWSLSKASIVSLINTLSPTATLTVTLSLGAVNKAFATSAGALDGSESDEWKNLIATKTNATISLV